MQSSIIGEIRKVGSFYNLVLQLIYLVWKRFYETINLFLIYCITYKEIFMKQEIELLEIGDLNLANAILLNAAKELEYTKMLSSMEEGASTSVIDKATGNNIFHILFSEDTHQPSTYYIQSIINKTREKSTLLNNKNHEGATPFVLLLRNPNTPIELIDLCIQNGAKIDHQAIKDDEKIDAHTKKYFSIIENKGNLSTEDQDLYNKGKSHENLAKAVFISLAILLVIVGIGLTIFTLNPIPLIFGAEIAFVFSVGISAGLCALLIPKEERNILNIKLLADNTLDIMKKLEPEPVLESKLDSHHPNAEPLVEQAQNKPGSTTNNQVAEIKQQTSLDAISSSITGL